MDESTDEGLPFNLIGAGDKIANDPSLIKNKRNVYNWQASHSTLRERFAYLLNKNILSDVVFVVGKEPDRQRIVAHKFLLSCGSVVFDALFNSSLATRSEEVELPDVEPIAFLNLLRYLYTDEKSVDFDNVMTTLYVAKKYAVAAMENHCVEFLRENLSSTNAVTLLTQALFFDEPELAALCLDAIDRNAEEALSTESFLEIDHKTLCSIIERNTLVILEANLLQAVVRWSCAECERQGLQATPENQRKVLGRALYLIRFPLMSVEQFAINVVQAGLLTESEAVQMFLYFVVNPKPPIAFIDKPRSFHIGTTMVLNRFEKTESRWGYSGTSDRVRVVVDRRIFVVGLGLFGATYGPSKYSVEIEIIHSATGRICGSKKTEFVSDSEKTNWILFKDPVELHSSTSYILAATLRGPDSFYGTRGKRKVSVDVPGAGTVNFYFSYAAGNNNGTSVEDGQIPEIIFQV